MHLLGMYPEDEKRQTPFHAFNKNLVLQNSPQYISESCYYCPEPMCGKIFKEANSLVFIEGKGVFDRPVDEMITEMMVDCPRKGAHGCDFSGTVKELRECHEELCPARIVPCPYVLKCRAKVIRADLCKHFEKDCPGVPFYCHGCCTMLPMVERELHTQQCEFALRSCQICNRGGFNADTLAVHQANGSCTALPGVCPFAEYGCRIGFMEMTNEYKKMHLAEFEVNHFELLLGVLSFCYKAASRWSESSSIHLNPALSNPLQPPVQSDELTQLKGDFVRLERFLTSKVEELEAAVTAALKNVVKRESLDQMSAVMHRVNKDIETLQKATEEMQRDLITLQKSVEAPSKPRKRLFPFTWRFASDHIIENDTQF